MRPSWISYGPKSNDWCSYETQTQRDGKDSHVKKEAEMGVMLPQAKECQPGATRSEEGGGGRRKNSPWSL